MGIYQLIDDNGVIEDFNNEIDCLNAVDRVLEENETIGDLKAVCVLGVFK